MLSGRKRAPSTRSTKASPFWNGSAGGTSCFTRTHPSRGTPGTSSFSIRPLKSAVLSRSLGALAMRSRPPGATFWLEMRTSRWALSKANLRLAESMTGSR